MLDNTNGQRRKTGAGPDGNEETGVLHARQGRVAIGTPINPQAGDEPAGAVGEWGFVLVECLWHDVNLFGISRDGLLDFMAQVRREHEWLDQLFMASCGGYLSDISSVQYAAILRKFERRGYTLYEWNYEDLRLLKKRGFSTSLTLYKGKEGAGL